MVKPVTKPIVSDEEQKFRDELYPDVKTVKNKNILCTSCNGSLKELILRGKPKTHPFLETLLCEKCNSFFGDGEFSVDEDGSDKYCRWCGQGGTLYLCSTCTAGFCKKCIKRNLPRAALKEVEDDDWQCFCCNVKPLYELRAHCWAANKFAAEYVNNEEGKRRRGKKSGDHDDDSQSEESEDSSSAKKRQNMDNSDQEEETTVRKKRGRKTQSEETKPKAGKNKSREKTKLYKPVVTKLAATLKDAISMTDLFKKKALVCSNKKISLSYIKDADAVIQVCGKVDSLLQSVESISNQLRRSVKEFLDDWKKEQGESDDKNESNDKIEKEAEDAEDKNNESNDKMDDDVEDKKTVNGIEDEKKSGDEEDKLGNEPKMRDDGSDSEHSKKSMDQDEDAEETVLKVKANDSDTDANEDTTKDDAFNKLLENKTDSKSPHKGGKFQKEDDDEDEDDDEENDKKNKVTDETPSKNKRVHDSSEEDDIPAKDRSESSKKLKTDHADGDN